MTPGWDELEEAAQRYADIDDDEGTGARLRAAALAFAASLTPLEREAARVTEQVSRSPMHGWHVGDAVGPERPDEPLVQELTGDHDWPPPELTGGVAAVFIHAFGDEPRGAYVQATGSDRDAVLAAFGRARLAVLAGFGAGWFGEVAPLLIPAAAAEQALAALDNAVCSPDWKNRGAWAESHRAAVEALREATDPGSGQPEPDEPESEVACPNCPSYNTECAALRVDGDHWRCLDCGHTFIRSDAEG